MSGTCRRRFGHSLRAQIIAVTVAAWLIPTAVLSAWLLTVLPRMEARVADSLTLEAEYAWSAAADNLDRLHALARDATYDGELTRIWEQRASELIGPAEFVRQSRNYLERKYGRESLCEAALYDPLGEDAPLLMTQSGNSLTPEEREGLRMLAREASGEIDTRCVLRETEGSLYLIRNLMNERMVPFGVLMLKISRDTLFRPLGETAAKWGGESETVFQTEAPADWHAPETGLIPPGRENTVIYVRHSDSRDWTMHWRLTVPGDTVYGETRRFRLILGGLILILIPVGVLIGFIAHRRITRPLELLADASRRIEGGELGVTVPMHGQDELGTLGKAFSGMSLRLQELIDRTYKEEIALRDAQIQALQSRINPHFINNALEDINWQARLDGSETASRMVSALSILLNASMADRDRRLVTLREEMKVADAYIFFAQERFGDRLVLTRRIDEETLEDELPLLTLQPVLENAVEHGIAPAGGGEILLQCEREDGALLIRIVNGGRPMDEADRARVEAALSGRTTGGHVGLNNIANRLRLIYHGRADISAETDREGRTAVTLRVPQEERTR